MPRKGTEGTKSPKVEQYRQMYENTPNLCKSQTYNELYNKLDKDGRLGRFIAVVQHCSISGLSIEDSVPIICKAFPSYIDERDLTVECFEDMIKNYSNISVAWGYGSLGDEISALMIKNKAHKLALKTESMTEIALYQEVFGKKEEVNTESKGTTVNFNLFKK